MAPPIIGDIAVTPMDSLDIEWRIWNFPSLSEFYYASPLFYFDNASWSINIFPNGDTDNDYDSYDHISLYLFRKSARHATNLEFSLGLKNSVGEKFAVKHFEHVFTRRKQYSGDTRYLKRHVIFSRKWELIPFNFLRVFCSVKCLKVMENEDEDEDESFPFFWPSTSGASVARSEKQVLSSEIGVGCNLGSFISPQDSKVLHDFKELFLKKEDCDVVMKVKGQEFSAHRNILKARSPVFASTFQSDMKEKATGVVEIEDCDPSCFLDFLCFLYCGEVKNLSEENVFSLFFTADKYDVQDLRTKCVDFLKEKLSVDTFCDTISLALKHSETELIKLTTDFFTKNASNIVPTVKWQSFLVENPTESNELLVKLLVPKSLDSS